MGAPDISYFSLFLCFLLLLIPLTTSFLLKLKIIKTTAISVIRMTLQLFLAGVYLKYLFEWNNPLLNIVWLMIMVIVATLSVIKNSELNLKLFALPAFLSFIISILLVVLYFNGLIINMDNLLEAKYLVVIGGMLLGNSLRGNIIGISNFYNSIKRNKNRYLYQLALGATQLEALIPYFRTSLNLSLKPTIATMMTIGIVSLPGMMTGQILGGSTPLVAVKYQIAIMIAIFTSINISVGLTILFTLKSSFDQFGVLKNVVFKKA